jgi:hypothetical protein
MLARRRHSSFAAALLHSTLQAVPVFDSPIDCTAWVIGGLWPAELSMITAETEAVAVAAVAMAAVSKAMTWPLSRTITPSPSAARRCRATTTGDFSNTVSSSESAVIGWKPMRRGDR